MLIVLFIGFFGLILLSVIMELLFPKRSMAFKTMITGLIAFSFILFAIYLVWDIGQRVG